MPPSLLVVLMVGKLTKWVWVVKVGEGWWDYFVRRWPRAFMLYIEAPTPTTRFMLKIDWAKYPSMRNLFLTMKLPSRSWKRERENARMRAEKYESTKREIRECERGPTKKFNSLLYYRKSPEDAQCYLSFTTHLQSSFQFLTDLEYLTMSELLTLYAQFSVCIAVEYCY